MHIPRNVLAAIAAVALAASTFVLGVFLWRQFATTAGALSRPQRGLIVAFLALLAVLVPAISAARRRARDRPRGSSKQCMERNDMDSAPRRGR